MPETGSRADGAALALACSITPTYTLPLLVALASLRARLPPERHVTLHLVHAGLQEAQLAAIARLVDVRPVALARSALEAIPLHGRYPREAAVPVLLGEVLPDDLDRVVFLDADVLVLDDPRELWTVDLEERPLGAVVDPAIPCCGGPRGVRDWRRRGIPADAPYFNAGVMAISLRAWRERAVGERALEYLAERRPRGSFLHQEALNAALWDAWLPLDRRWNLVSSLVGRPYGAPAPVAPGIVHFAGRCKPWRSRLAGPFDAAYRAALEVVEPLVGPSPSRLRDRLLGAYDRRLRDRLYPLERVLWSHGLI